MYYKLVLSINYIWWQRAKISAVKMIIFSLFQKENLVICDFAQWFVSLIFTLYQNSNEISTAALKKLHIFNSSIFSFVFLIDNSWTLFWGVGDQHFCLGHFIRDYILTKVWCKLLFQSHFEEIIILRFVLRYPQILSCWKN